MTDLEILKEIGLSDGEIKIYLTLLQFGELNVMNISKHSGLHRTNIYDSLEKLKEKGFISYLSKENKQFFRANNPENMLDYLKEKESQINKIIPELKNIQSEVNEKVSVEIFKGEKGMKSVLREILKERLEVIGYSVSNQLRKYLPKFSEYYFLEQEKHKIKHRFIYTEQSRNPLPKFYSIKYLPKQFESSIINISYGNIILNLIWEPELIAIKITSKQLSDNFKKHFEILWKNARELKS